MAQSHVEVTTTTEELAQASMTLWLCVWKESGQGPCEVSRCEVVEDSIRTDLTDLFVSLFCLVLNFSYTNVFGWSSGRFRFVVLDFHSF